MPPVYKKVSDGKFYNKPGGVVTEITSFPGQVSLLYSNDGTESATITTTLDSYALASQLTVKDRLLVIVNMEAITQASGVYSLQNITDGVSLSGSMSNINAGACGQYVAWIQNQRSATTKISTFGERGSGTSTATFGSAGVAVTQAWTGNWSLGLVTSGGTVGITEHWKWAIYLVKGQ